MYAVFLGFLGPMHFGNVAKTNDLLGPRDPKRKGRAEQWGLGRGKIRTRVTKVHNLTCPQREGGTSLFPFSLGFSLFPSADFRALPQKRRPPDRKLMATQNRRIQNHKRDNTNYIELIPRQRLLSFSATMDLERTTADSLSIKLAALQTKRFRFHC